jgi:PIN domain nuclease of toxin-antitoxin system
MTMPTPSEIPVYVSDAHPLLWHLASDRRLSDTAHAILTEVDEGHGRLVIPAVALAELAMVVEKGRLPILPTTLSESIAHWRAATNITFTSLTPELVMDAMQLTTIPDIFDRLIVAEARALGVPLITRDSAIVGSKLVTTIW